MTLAKSETTGKYFTSREGIKRATSAATRGVIMSEESKYCCILFERPNYENNDCENGPENIKLDITTLKGTGYFTTKTS